MVHRFKIFFPVRLGAWETSSEHDVGWCYFRSFFLYIKYSLVPTPCLIYGDISLKWITGRMTQTSAFFPNQEPPFKSDHFLRKKKRYEIDFTCQVEAIFGSSNKVKQGITSKSGSLVAYTPLQFVCAPLHFLHLRKLKSFVDCYTQPGLHADLLLTHSCLNVCICGLIWHLLWVLHCSHAGNSVGHATATVRALSGTGVDLDHLESEYRTNQSPPLSRPIWETHNSKPSACARWGHDARGVACLV